MNLSELTLDRNRKLIYIDNELKHPTDLFNDNRYYRYGYYQFPFAVENARFYAQLNGPVMEPYKDLTGHSTDAYVGAREWSSVENGQYGVALIQWDSSLMEFGEIHPDFDHYELYRSSESGFECSPATFVCDVRNEVYDGIPYRVARYEDTGLDSHRRYYYRIRPVSKDGSKGAFSEEFSALTRQP